jgi:hypothetical protein
MDPLIEMMIRDTVPVAREVLGLPDELAELSVRHAYTCPKRPCEVERYLTSKMLEAAAKSNDVPIEQITDLTLAVSKGLADTLRIQKEQQGGLAPGEAEAAYRQGVEALHATMELLRGGSRD